MKLWLVTPQPDLPETNPWEPWYDKAFGFVIRAETETDARRIASENAGDEARSSVYFSRSDVWEVPELSSCVELHQDGEEGLVLEDGRAA